MSSLKALGWVIVPAAAGLISLALLPADFAVTDHARFTKRQFGVEVGMTEAQARAAILSNWRFRYSGTQACEASTGSTGCADATQIDQYRVDGLLADGWVNLGIRDDRVVYIYADKSAAI